MHQAHVVVSAWPKMALSGHHPPLPSHTPTQPSASVLPGDPSDEFTSLYGEQHQKPVS